MTTHRWKVRAKQASRPTYPDPITMRTGDLIEIVGEEDDGWIWCRNRVGKEGWVPLSYLSAEGEGKVRTALTDYNATELPVEEGEEFLVDLEEHGWLWSENAQGQWGWVRLAQVERISEA